MMSLTAKVAHLLFAATCIRNGIDDDGTQSAPELNALARIHLAITDEMQRIKQEHGLT